MKPAYQQIEVDREGNITCVRLRQRRIDEPDIQVLGYELTDLVEQDGCRRLVLSLGPGSLDCLFSVFLAKLVMVHRRLLDHGGALILCDVTPEVMSVFEACKLQTYFEFAPDRAAAVAAMAKKAIP
jgi:anti-anti-sigma factor